MGIDSFSIPRFAENDPRSLAALLCQPCRLAPPAFTRAVAYGVYDRQLRSLIHLLKYDGMRPIADQLGELLAASLETAFVLTPELISAGMLVVPVPLHRAKQRQRGFNHADLLARAASAALRRRYPECSLEMASGVLLRRRNTPSQAGLTPRQRRKNLRGAFVVPDPARVGGRHILLVDDVYTTGATARAVSRVLIDAGAASVRVATVARAQREGVAFWDGSYLARQAESAAAAP